MKRKNRLLAIGLVTIITLVSTVLTVFCIYKSLVWPSIKEKVFTAPSTEWLADVRSSTITICIFAALIVGVLQYLINKGIFSLVLKNKVSRLPTYLSIASALVVIIAGIFGAVAFFSDYNGIGNGLFT